MQNRSTRTLAALIATAALVAVVGGGTVLVRSNTSGDVASVPSDTATSATGSLGDTTASRTPTRATIELGATPGREALVSPEPKRPAELPGTLSVRVKPGVTDAQLATAAGVPVSAIGSLGGEYRTVAVGSANDLEATDRALSSSGLAVSAEPLRTRQLAYTPPSYSAPNDPYYSAPMQGWWLGTKGMGAASYWQKGQTGGAIGSTGLRASGDAIKIAVLDSGFYLDHPDKGANIVGRYDFAHALTVTKSASGFTLSATQDSNVTPPPLFGSGVSAIQEASHGTMVAGQIAAAANNGVGVAGAAYDTKVYVYKVSGPLTASWFDYDGTLIAHKGESVMLDPIIAQAIRRAADDGCKIISMSFGGVGTSSDIQAAVKYAQGKGALVIAATGNEYNKAATSATAYYPAGYAGVLGVGSYGLTAGGAKRPSDFSNAGYGLDIMGPGESIFGLTSTAYDYDGAGPIPAGYDYWNGTSMATPAVAAAASWIWRAAPALNAQQVSQVLISTGEAGTEAPYIDPTAAYDQLIASYPVLQAPLLSAPPFTTTRTIPLAWTAPGNRVGTGTTFDVSLNGTTRLAGTSANSASIVAPADGQYTVRVQAKNPLNWWDLGSSVTSTLVVDSVPTRISAFGYGNGHLEWVDTESNVPHTTELEIDGVTTTVGTDEFLTAALSPGSHDATLTVTDTPGRSAVATTTFEIDPAYASDSVAAGSPSTRTITYGQSTSVSVRGLTGASPSSLGGLVIWESSTNGSTWSYLGSSATTATVATVPVKPSVNTYYRARIPGAAPSAAVRVNVRAKVGTPSAKSSVRKGRTTTISGRVDPKHAAGSTVATVYIERRVSGRWRLERKATVKSSNGLTWSLSWKPKATGSYRIYAVHTDASHVKSVSGYRKTTSR